MSLKSVRTGRASGTAGSSDSAALSGVDSVPLSLSGADGPQFV